MQLTAIFLIAAGLSVSAAGFSQKVNLKVKDAPLDKVFEDIRQQTGFEFLFTYEMLAGAKPVTVDLAGVDLQDAVTACLAGQPLTFIVKGKTVVIRQKAVVAAPEATIDIHGRVTDSLGTPMAGASVTVKGTKIGTQTNAKGEFVIKGVVENVTLVVTYTGFEPRQYRYNGQKTVIIPLVRSMSPLDEIQVIAYGTTTQRLSTGNISTVKAADIEKQPVANPLLALEGRVPGLTITQESGITGGPVTIRVQGQNSIQYGNDPLIIVDGVPYPSSFSLRTGLENVLGTNVLPSQPSPLNFINPSDIESIDILKDADATAIYGSRAANGAILITTKKGKAGQTRMDINLQQGVGKVTRKLDMLNAHQYLNMRYEAYKNDSIALSSLTPASSNYDLTIWDTTHSTDWQKTLIGGTAQFTNVNASISGGTSTIQYMLGGTYQRQTVVFPGSFADQRGTLHLTLNNASVNQKFHLQFSGSYMIDDNLLPGNDLTAKAILLEPVAPKLYNANGTLNWAPTSSGNSTWDNPLIDILYRKYHNNTNNLVSNIQLSYLLFRGLELKTSLGYNKLVTNDFSSTPLSAIRPENRNVSPSPRQSAYGFRDVHSWIIEPQLNYQTQISSGKLDALLGASIQQNSNNVTNIIGSGYTSDEALRNTGAAVSLTSGVFYSAYKYNALFGRLNYNWQNKYILDFTARRDGSSRFGENNKFHNFGSAGLAWIFSQQAIFQKSLPFLSFGKLRASYGTTGSDQIGDYAYLNLYNTVSASAPYQNSTGLMPSGLPNPYLSWEETRKWQMGLDLGFLNDRVLLGATYARNRSSNQLLSYALPTITGFSSISENFPATVQNISWEISLKTTNIRAKNISWTSSVSLTIPRNELIDFPNLQTSSYSSTLVVGQPISVIKAYHYLGVDPTTGKYMVADSHGTPTVSPSPATDRIALVNKLPRFYGGLQNSVQYKGLQLDFLFQFVKQIGTRLFFNNGTAVNPGAFLAASSNQPITVLKRWQKPGDLVSIQRYSSSFSSPLRPTLLNANISDANFADASFIRLKNLSLSYGVPEKWMKGIHFRNARIYVLGQNLLTITKYQGLDPENQNTSVLPPLKVITAGLQLGF